LHSYGCPSNKLKANQIITLTPIAVQRILLIAEFIQKKVVMPDLVAYVDGGCLGNPGPSGIGLVIDGGEDGPVRIAKWIGHQDNNVAEYVALLEALQYAVGLKAKTLHVYSDSQVVVRQMRGEYLCRSPRLYSLHWTCQKLARDLKFSISHVPREDNCEANQLAHAAVRGRQVTLKTAAISLQHSTLGI
jgi:ribonuclease HI